MGGLKRNPWLSGLGVLLAILVVSGGYARADVTTDQAGSIIIFPKVISDGTRETLISIVNVKNMPTIAHCIYNNSPSGFCSVTTSQFCRFDDECPATETCQLTTPGRCSVTSTTGCSVDSQCPAFETCVHQCEEHNFDIALTGQQPTMWVVGLGRFVDALDPFTGLDPGTVPPQHQFIGELKCYVTDGDGMPIMQNSLIGTASIGGSGPADYSEYNGITVLAASAPAGDLNLNDTEYNACPSGLIVNHWADGSTDSFSGARIVTELTLVPCSEDFENQIPPPARALINIWNEFEERISRPVDVGCYLNRQLSEIDPVFTRSSIKTDFAKTRITTPSSSVCYTGTNRGGLCSTNADCPNFLTSINGTALGCLPRPGLLAVSEEFYQTPVTLSPISNTLNSGTAAANAHVEGDRTSVGGDVIVLPSLK